MSSYCVFYIYFIYYTKIDMDLSGQSRNFYRKKYAYL